MSAAERLRDPFGLTADTGGYVPRDATEEALAALVATLREGHRPAALVGPPGLGKTLLLHLVAKRLDDRLRPVYLPYAALPLDELCAWALSLLGFSQSDDTIGDLIQTAAHLLARGSGLLLLIDDAGAMPLPTARKLGDLVAASRGALRLLIAAAEGPSASRMLAATGANVHLVRLLEPMSEDETRRYVAARLTRAGTDPEVAARFDDAALQSIHRLSAGIPRRVHSVASAVLRGNAPESGADPIEALETAPEVEAIADAMLPPEALVEHEQVIDPVYERLRASLAARPQARIEAPPSTRAVFATAILFGALCVSVPWLRSAVAPPTPSVASPRRPEPAREPPPRPTPAAEAGASAEVTIPPAAASADLTIPPPAAATLSVQVNARPWANIEVNGVDLGPTPIAGIPLLAGRHFFRARMPDGRVLEREVEVSAENRFIVFE